MVATVATTTDAVMRASAVPGGRIAEPGRHRYGPDPLTVGLLGLTAFLVVLALLANQLPTGPASANRRVPIVRRIYRTTIIETIVGAPGPSGRSVSQSVASSGSGVVGPALTSRVS